MIFRMLTWYLYFLHKNVLKLNDYRTHNKFEYFENIIFHVDVKLYY